MGSDRIAYFWLFLVFLGEFHTEDCVRKLRILIWNFSYIVEKTGPFGNFRVQTKLWSHSSTDVGHFTCVLQKVLAVWRTVFHSSYQLDELDVHSVDSEVYAGPLSSLHNFIFKLLLYFCHYFFDTCRMYTSVHNKLMQGKSCNFSPYRVKRWQKYCFWSVVNYNLHSCSSLESPDVTSFTSDDTSFDLIAFDVEHSYGVFNCRFGCCSLYSVDYNPFGFFAGCQSRFVHNIIDIWLCLGLCLGLHVFDELVLSFLGRHSGDAFYLLYCLCTEPVALLWFFRYGFNLGFQVLAYRIGFLVFSAELGILLVDAVLLLLDPAFRFTHLVVLLIDILLMLAFQLQEFFFCLKNLFLLDFLRFKLGLLNDFLLLTVQNHFPD